MSAWFKGELVGTFLLVFFGCGAVATAVAVGAPTGLFQVAIVWGLGLAAAIFLTAKLSGAHLNPAITLAFAAFRKFPMRRVPGYFSAQFLGTALLALAIFGFTAKDNNAEPGPMTPLAIGLTLTTLICIFAPLTMAGFNPARDLAPRIFSYLAGWGAYPFSTNGIGWLTVYIMAPCLGGLTGGWMAHIIHPHND